MRNYIKLTVAVFGLLLLDSSSVLAQGPVPQQTVIKNICSSTGNSSSLNSGMCTVATGVNATAYTGWILVDGYDMLDLDITFTDANDSVTALTVSCQGSNDSSTANGSGYDICSVGTTSGTSTYTCPNTRSITTGTAEKFTMTIGRLKHAYVNCAFLGTGTPAAADTVAITANKRIQ